MLTLTVLIMPLYASKFFRIVHCTMLWQKLPQGTKKGNKINEEKIQTKPKGKHVELVRHPKVVSNKFSVVHKTKQDR